MLVVLEKSSKPLRVFGSEGNIIKVSKREISHHQFIQKLNDLEQTLNREGIQYILAGSASILKKVGVERLKGVTFRSNVDIIVDEPEKVAHMLSKHTGAKIVGPHDTDSYVVQDMGDGSLYILPLFPKVWNVVDRDGFVVTLIPKRENILVHANIGDFPVLREVNTVTPDQPIAYKFVRGSKNDIEQLKTLAREGMLSNILEGLFDHLVPYSVTNKFHMVMKSVIKDVRTFNPAEAVRLRELYTSIKNRARELSIEPHLTPRHPIPVLPSGRMFLPPGEQVIINPDEIKEYMRRLP